MEFLKTAISKTPAIVDNRKVSVEFNFHVTKSLCQFFNIKGAKEFLGFVGNVITEFSEKVAQFETTSNAPIYGLYEFVVGEKQYEVALFAFFSKTPGKFSIEYCAIEERYDFAMLLTNLGLANLLEDLDETEDFIDPETAEIIQKVIKAKKLV